MEEYGSSLKTGHANGAVVAGLTKSGAVGRSHIMDSLAELEELLKLEAKREPAGRDGKS